jgi:hypothetical protein
VVAKSIPIRKMQFLNDFVLFGLRFEGICSNKKKGPEFETPAPSSELSAD